jgi:hypothetical protein
MTRIAALRDWPTATVQIAVQCCSSLPTWTDGLRSKCKSDSRWEEIDHPLAALKAVYGEAAGVEHFIYKTLSEHMNWEVLVHDRDSRELWCAIRASGPVVNAAGTLHGGATATLFDGAFGLLFSASKWRGFTASLNIDCRQVGICFSVLLDLLTLAP